MIVFDLKCASEHVFEACFASSAAYEEQRATAMIACPLCGDCQVTKAVMASNIAAKGNRAGRGLSVPALPDDLAAKLAAMQGELLKDSAWVGSDFPDRVRAMHLGEEPQAIVHGESTIAEAKALIDEGIAVMPLPFPVVPPNARN